MYFPSMVKYMDKKIGQVLDKVKAAGLANNTIVIYVGDNGTDLRIYSYFRNKRIKGGKSPSVCNRNTGKYDCLGAGQDSTSSIKYKPH